LHPLSPNLYDNLNKLPFFQSVPYANLLVESGQEYYWIYTTDNDNRYIRTSLLVQITGQKGILKYSTTRALIIHGPVLLAEISKDELNAVLRTMFHHLPWYTLFVQIRNEKPPEIILEEACIKAGFYFNERLNLLTPVQDIKTAWQRMSAGRRRQVRQSLRHELLVNDAVTSSDVDSFYKILSSLYKRIGKPLPTKAFFQIFLNKIHNKELKALFLVARFENQIIGGIVAPFDEERKAYEFYISARDKDFAKKHVYPSVALTWEAMQRASEVGCHTFDFMGMGLPGQHYGVREFKLRFGGQMINPGRWNRVFCPWLFYPVKTLYKLLIVVNSVCHKIRYRVKSLSERM